MEQFSVRTKIMTGNALDDLARQIHRGFVVTDRFMAESGRVSYVTDALDQVGAQWQVFSDVQALSLIHISWAFLISLTTT